MFEEIYQSFTNRDWAVIVILFGSTLFLALSKRTIRTSFFDVIKHLCNTKIILVLFAAFVYYFACLWLMYRLDIWNFRLFKDAFFWIFMVGLPTLFSVTKAKERVYFVDIFLKAFAWSAVMEFALNLFTFGIWIELLFVTSLTFLVLLLEFAKYQQKQEQKVIKLLNWLLTVVSLFLIGYFVSQIIMNWKKTATLDNFRSFIFPFNILFMTLPLFYGIKLYMEYEMLFILIKFRVTNSRLAHNMCRSILWKANINMDKVVSVRKNISKLYEVTDENLPNVVQILISQ
jgi:hypothetical protein